MSSFTAPLKYEKTNMKTALGQEIVRLTEGFSFHFDSYDRPLWIIHVPKGYTTDLATMPGPLKHFFKPDGPYAQAAALHDWLWWKANSSRGYHVADLIFDEALEVLKISPPQRFLFYHSVRAVARLKELVNLLTSRIRI